LLDVPEAEDSHGLRGDSDDEQVGEVEGVVSHDGVLKSSDHCDGRVQGVAKQKIACEVVSLESSGIGLSCLPIK